MEPDDPEKRTADLERQLAEQPRVADLPASNSDPGERRFAVTAVPNAWKIVSTFGLLLLGSVAFQKIWNSPYGGLVAHFGMLLGLVVGWTLALRWLFTKKVVICLTTAGLTIDRRPGQVFPLRDAELGQWRSSGWTRGGPYAGSALYLTSGENRFVLADGRNPRSARHVPVEGPQVNRNRDIDAWMKSSAFDELLAIVGSARGG